MSSTNQTHKRYLQEADGTVYWPITAWDAVVGKPDGLVDKPALDAAIAGIQKPNLSGYLTQASLAGYVVKSELPDFTKFAMKTDLPTFDPNTVYTKDEVNNYVSQSVQNSLSTFLNGDYAKAIAQLKELSDALSGDHSVLAGLLTQLSNKANVGDSYLKSEEDAKFATKGEVSVAINERLPKIDNQLAEELLLQSMKVTPDFATGHMNYSVSPVSDTSTTGAVVNLYVDNIRMTVGENGHLITEVVS